MVLSLPYDIQLAVTRFLSVRDILNLQLTCKELRKTLESRYVWKHVLRNIFSAFQLPSLRNALLQLSADELKKKAIVATRLAHMWGQETVIPQKVRKFKCDCDVTSFRLLPGGKWMVVAQCGGSLELHDMRSEPPTLWIVDRTLCDDIDFFFVDLLLSVSQSGQILAILETCSGKHSHRDGVFSQIAVFRIDIEPKPSMRLITKASKDFFIDTYCAEGDLLFFAWTDDDTKPYGVIRKMAFTPGQVEQEVVMGFPTKNVADNDIIGAAIISSGKLLALTSWGIFVYDIPCFETLDSATSQMAIPVWEHELEEAAHIISPSFRVLHPTPDAHPEGQVIILMNGSMVTMTPVPGHSIGYHLHFSDIQHLENLEVLESIGSQLFWSSGAGQELVVKTCAVSQAPLGPGFICGRERVVKLEGKMTYAQPLSAEVPRQHMYEESVLDEAMTWDEESGRLCLLLERTIDEQKEIVIIDFV